MTAAAELPLRRGYGEFNRRRDISKYDINRVIASIDDVSETLHEVGQ